MDFKAAVWAFATACLFTAYCAGIFLAAFYLTCHCL